MVNVAKLQEPAVTALPRSAESVLFAPDDPVLPGSMAFGDHRWDLSILGLAAHQVAGHAVLNFDRFLKPVVLGGSEGPSEQIRLSPIWLLRAKELIAILLAPTRHTSRGQLDVFRVRESSSPSAVRAALAHIYALAGSAAYVATSARGRLMSIWVMTSTFMPSPTATPFSSRTRDD